MNIQLASITDDRATQSSSRAPPDLPKALQEMLSKVRVLDGAIMNKLERKKTLHDSSVELSLHVFM